MPIRRALIFVFALLLTAGAVAEAKTYSAERFDSRIRILNDGSLEVVETVVFRFEDGSFTYVFRDIPTRRTDGIEIISAEMDGRVLPFGTADGQVEVRRKSRVQVRWHFAPRAESSHTFVLTYRVRGVVQQSAAGDFLEWIALPTKHDYRIDSSEVTVEAPVRFAAPPALESRRVGEASVERAGDRVQILAREIGKDGWVKARLQFPEGTLIAAAPQWQQRQRAAAALAPRWAVGALLIFAAGVGVLFAMRQNYDSPAYPTERPQHWFDSPPDNLRPALAGAVASNGGVSLHHAMSTLFALADQGVINITEGPRKWGSRQFVVRREPSRRPAAPEESVLLNAAFGDTSDRAVDEVPLDKARGRVGKAMREFKRAVRQELRNLGLWHDDRASVRSRYLTVSVVLLIVASLAAILAGLLANQFGGWTFLPAAATAAVAILGFIFYGALTPLTNEGLQRSEEWRAYQKHLKNIARDRAHLARESPSQLLPFAVALGLSGVWSRFFKQHPGSVPAWFQTLTPDEGAFPAFVAVGGAGEGGGAGGAGGGGGAAGGGGSGAG